MLDKVKNKIREAQEMHEKEAEEEKHRLLSMSEKELLVEILYELRRIEKRIDSVESTIFIK